METNAEQLFKTSDVYLAASLAASGHDLLDLEREDPKRCRFIFEDTQAVRDDVEEFWRKGLCIEPQRLFNALRSLKWRLHNE